MNADRGGDGGRRLGIFTAQACLDLANGQRNSPVFGIHSVAVAFTELAQPI
jgi:hypothetical protein